MRQASKTKCMCEADVAAIKERCRTMDALERPLAIGPLINTSAYTVRDSMSILRAYKLFRTMGCRQMVVTDISNKVVGMLTRACLVEVLAFRACPTLARACRSPARPTALVCRARCTGLPPPARPP